MKIGILALCLFLSMFDELGHSQSSFAEAKKKGKKKSEKKAKPEEEWKKVPWQSSFKRPENVKP